MKSPQMSPNPLLAAAQRRARLVAALALLFTSPSFAQPANELGRHFGFEASRIIPIDDDCGPVIFGDFNGDSRPDMAVANNRKSRIELHFTRAQMRTEAEVERELRPNELPPSPWFDRRDVSVPQRVTAMKAYDADGDGKLDIVYAGAGPLELVVLRQVDPQKFEVASRKRVAELSARQAGLAIADVAGDGSAELLALVNGKLTLFPFSATGAIGEARSLNNAGSLAAIFVEDYNGDGLQDVLGVIPDDASPLRLWLQEQDPRQSGKSGLLARELRFEMPGLREAEPVRFPDRKAASIGVIERASRRLVFFDLLTSPVQPPDSAGSEQQVQAEVTAFTDGASKDRSIATVDIDGDGMTDLLATDSAGNTVVLYKQARGVGLTTGTPFSAFKKPKALAVGQWDGSAGPEVFVLSEEEKTVGVSTYDAESGRLGFPIAVSLKSTGAFAPVAIAYLELGTAGAQSGAAAGGTLAIVTKDKRDHQLELHTPTSAANATEPVVVPLKGVTRPPQTMLAADADQDGRTDILLFTANEPTILVRSVGDASKPWEVLSDQDQRQYGLVQAANADNTALLDVNGDGKPELLIADENFVRACVYDAIKGWRVVEQATISEPGTKLVGLTVLSTGRGSENASAGGGDLIVADRGNSRLLRISRSGAAGGGGGRGEWSVGERMRLLGFPLGAIKAGRFSGSDDESLLCQGEDGFGLVRLKGQRSELRQFAAFRAESEDRVEHDIEVGDLNGDGYVDLAVLDAGEQMCSIFTFSATRRLLAATEFEVFQTRLFSGGAAREFEPRSASIVDITGDGKDDLVLTVHDRVIVYPQATK